MHKETIFKVIKTNIDRKKNLSKPYVIGINGVDTSGKSQFAIHLAQYLVKENYSIQIIHVDDFHNPKKIRYSGSNQVDNYYNKSFDLNTLTEKLLIPIKTTPMFSKKLTLLDLDTDTYSLEKEYICTKDTIVIIEGVFLYRRELKDFIDYKIFIDIPLDEMIVRAKFRDVPKLGQNILSKYKEKYIPAQQNYIDNVNPHSIADLVIDNQNWNKPKIIHPTFTKKANHFLLE